MSHWGDCPSLPIPEVRRNLSKMRESLVVPRTSVLIGRDLLYSCTGGNAKCGAFFQFPAHDNRQQDKYAIQSNEKEFQDRYNLGRKMYF